MNLIYLFLLSFIIVSCSSFSLKKPDSKPSKSKITKNAPKIFNKNQLNLTVFDSPSHHTNFWMIFKRAQDGKFFNILINGKIKKINLNPGEYLLTHVKFENNFYSSNQLITHTFQVFPEDASYGGSLLWSCPQVEASDEVFLKEMKFFQRWKYNFKDSQCELVVGDRREKINPIKELQKIRLKTGF